MSRKRAVPADGDRTSVAFLNDDQPNRTKPDLRPATPLAAPPRELVPGDRLAVHVADHGDFIVWGPYRFTGWRTIPSGARQMTLERVLPWGSNLSLSRWSYGDYTGIPADRATTFYRFADEVTFLHFCPECRGKGEQTGGVQCSTCAGIGRIAYPSDIFKNPPRFEHRVQHYKQGKGSQPGFLTNPSAVNPNIPHIVVGFEAGNDETGHVAARFHVLPKATVDRIMSEPDAERVFTLDRLGNIISE